MNDLLSAAQALLAWFDACEDGDYGLFCLDVLSRDGPAGLGETLVDDLRNAVANVT